MPTVAQRESIRDGHLGQGRARLVGTRHPQGRPAVDRRPYGVSQRAASVTTTGSRTADVLSGCASTSDGSSGHPRAQFDGGLHGHTVAGHHGGLGQDRLLGRHRRAGWRKAERVARSHAEQGGSGQPDVAGPGPHHAQRYAALDLLTIEQESRGRPLRLGTLPARQRADPLPEALHEHRPGDPGRVGFVEGDAERVGEHAGADAGLDAVLVGRLRGPTRHQPDHRRVRDRVQETGFETLGPQHPGVLGDIEVGGVGPRLRPETADANHAGGVAAVQDHRHVRRPPGQLGHRHRQLDGRHSAEVAWT